MAFFFFQYSLNFFFKFGNTLQVLVTLKQGRAMRLGNLLFSILPLHLSWLWSFHHGCSLFWIFICIRCYGIYFLRASFYFDIIIYFSAFYLLSSHLRWSWASFWIYKVVAIGFMRNGGDGCILSGVNTLLCMGMRYMITKIKALFVMLD